MNNENPNIDDFQIKALHKLVNSGILHTIYPMIDTIDVNVNNKNRYLGKQYPMIELVIKLNDPTINSQNIWGSSEFDPYYLVDKYLRELLPYIGINNNTTLVTFKVYSPDGKFIIRGD
jgi:hypothetical protein